MAVFAGHPLPDPSQDSTASFWSGGLDYRRVTGRVLMLPQYEFTGEHRASAAALGSAEGLRAALESDGPPVAALIAGVFVFRWLVMALVVCPAAELYLPASHGTGSAVPASQK